MGAGNAVKNASDVFCMMPWVHFHVTQLGTVTPCCQAPWQQEQAFGNINLESIETIWNGEAMAGFRKNMLKGRADTRCESCYQKEKQGFTSLRQITNKNYQHKTEIVSSTRADGKVPHAKPVYFDIRFSNVCNLRCRICGPWSSSSWHNDAVALGMKDAKIPAITTAIQDEEAFFKQFGQVVHGLEELYFAGGEPLVMEQHYRILNLLIEQGKTDVKLVYNTNFSSFDFKQVNVLDLWKKFSRVSIAASLDASGSRGELLRKNLNWKQAEANRIRLMKELPQAEFMVSPTLNAYNLMHLPNFHRDWVERGLIGVEDFIPTLLIKPKELAIGGLPIKYRKEALEHYIRHIEWMNSQKIIKPEKFEHMHKQFQNVISVLKKSEKENRSPELLNSMEALDKLRNEKTMEVFPELGILKEA